MQLRLNRSLLARTLGFSRHSYYYRPRLPAKDRTLAERIRSIYRDDDDTLGAKKLAKQLSQDGTAVNHKRVAKVMRTQDITARPRKAKYTYPGKTAEPFTNLTRAMAKYQIELHPNHELRKPEVFRSDILEGRLADSSKVRVAFAWREATTQILSLVIDWRMQAELIVRTVERIPEACVAHIRQILQRSIIWHTDQGSQYGSDVVVDELIRQDFIASMNRAGTPTDNAGAERLVGEFKHAVLRRRSYHRAVTG